MSQYAYRLSLIFIPLLLLSLAVQSQNPSNITGEHIIMLTPRTSLETFILQAPSDLDIQVKKTLSDRLNIHLIEIQTKPGITYINVQKKLESHPDLVLSQQNHYVRHRRSLPVIPNDSLFQEQWNLNNTGQLSGKEDADIDAPEAWDITTGGISIQNDPIVIAVIDEGFDLNHPDVSWWKNSNEIPNNGIDDDQNGYVDDFDGWSTISGSDSIVVKLHGTHVSGIASARGNNLLGVAGVSWNTQIMPVVGFNLDGNGLNTEALVVEAYAYVYEMRLLYNETRGSSGAFIVATNTSFGLERGRPENSPIWCALYDSLGTLGILNAVATTNATRNVDIEGDIPSNCPSDFLLVTTQTDRNDLKIGGSFAGGTGRLNVDLAAPGEEILSTGTDSQYTILSGTSMASPHVAGVVSLVYSALCGNILAQYKNNPSDIAKLIRQLILDSVDPIDTLRNEIASGGRLNAYQTLLAVDSLCQTVSNTCGLTYFLQANSITDSSAILSWELINESTSYSVRYRPVTDTLWNTTTLLDTELTLSNLNRCTTYEFQVSTLCANDISEFTSSLIFTTDGCCEPPTDITVENLAAGSSQLSWNSIFGADRYEVDLRPQGIETWSSISVTDTVLLIDTLASCAFYEYRIRTICDTLTGVYSEALTFRTLDCGLCIDGDYCEIKGENSLNVSGAEWIERIRIGPLNNVSGNNQGYGSFLFEEKVELTVGIPYEIELTPGFTRNAFEEYWLIWIDLNRNGTFDQPEEIVFDSEGTSAQAIIDTIIIPYGAMEGNSRLRVAMQFIEAPPVCGNFLNGEAEDYCIEIVIDSSLCLPPNDWEVAVLDESSVSLMINDLFNADEIIIRYKALDRSEWQYQTLPGENGNVLIDQLIPCTGYEIQTGKICLGDTSEFSSSRRILTKGCGACTDEEYCNSMGLSSRDEWIDRIGIGERVFQSGNDGGLGDHTFFQFTLIPGVGYPLLLRPGFNSEPFAEQWRVWIDWNQNGSFEAPSELIFSSESGSTRPISDSLFVPEDARLGTTRMRVSMQFGDLPEACEDLEFGEVEDYCVTVTNVTSTPELADELISIYPNPFTNQLHIEFGGKIDEIQVSTVVGQKLEKITTKGQSSVSISTSVWPSGVYYVLAKTQRGTLVRKVVKP